MESTLVNRIAKLLAKTVENGCTRAEADSAYAMAARLLAEHNLTMEEVAGAAAEGPESVDVGEFHGVTYEQHAAMAVVREMCLAYPWIEKDRVARDGRVASRFTLRYFGTRENTATALFLHRSFLAALGRLWAAYRAETGAGPGSRNAFVQGVVAGLRARIREEKAAAEARHREATGTAVVLADREARLKREFGDRFAAYASTKRFAPGVREDAAARTAGYAAGRSLRLDRGLDGASRPALGE